jgi:uncharacterized protein (TIGR02284 family)
MYTNDALMDVLNDLVKINNDRIAGYERAIKECKDEDVDLKGLFRNMANESQEYVAELGDLIVKSGGRPTDDTTAPGKIYRGWMDLKAVFTGSDRKSLLESCEFGEDAAQKAYQAALTAEVEMDSESRRLIAEQQSSLKNSHDVIKKYRDLQASIA